jgi:hypothetical protein
MPFVNDVVTLFGCLPDHPRLQALLSPFSDCKLSKPDDGSQHLTSKAGGFELSFKDPDAAPRRKFEGRLLGVFVYAGRGKYQRFIGDLPFGFDFGDDRATILAKRIPDRTWLIGKGRVAVSHAAPSHDAYHTERFNCIVDYDNDGAIHHLFVGLPKPFDAASEWRAEPTWQELAEDPATKVAAINKYRKDTGVGLAEAKAIVDAHIARALL